MCFTTRQIVRDEQVGQAEPLLQVEQQVDDLRLHRDVERRDRLVGDDEARVERQRARDADALALAAAEGVREAVACTAPAAPPGRAAPRRACAGCSRRADAVDQQRLADDVADHHARIERGERILEDHLHVRPQRRAAPRGRGRRRRRLGRRSARKRIAPDGRLQRAQDAARRSSSCRSRIRRPAPASRPASIVKLHAVDGAHAARPSCAASPRRIGKCFFRSSTSRTRVMRASCAAPSRRRGSSSRRARRRPRIAGGARSSQRPGDASRRSADGTGSRAAGCRDAGPSPRSSRAASAARPGCDGIERSSARV